MKFHLRTNGAPGVCTAEEGKCPLGQNNPHFATPEAAREAYETSQEEDLFSTESKSSSPSFITPVPETFYHVTTSAAYEKIKETGLNPAIGERSKALGEDAPRIYMFDSKVSMEDAFGSWLGEEFDEEEELVLLSIPSHKLNEIEPTYDDGESSTEWTTIETIAATDIILETDEL